MLNNFSGKVCYLVFGFPVPLYLQYFLPTFLLFKPITKYIRLNIVRILVIISPLIVYLIRLVRNDFFFLSDDFAHLWWSYSNSYLDTFRIAMLEGGIWVGHRIFLGFWLFKAIYDLFGTDIKAYLLVIFFLNVINTLLLYNVLRKLSKSLFSILVAFIFATNYVWWISNIHELLAGTFILLAFISWMEWVSRKNKKDLTKTTIYYTLALLTKEITFLFYPVAIFYLVFKDSKKKSVIKKLKGSWIFALVFGLYTVFYASTFINYFNLPKGGGYVMSFTPSVVVVNLSHYFSALFPVFNGSLWGVITIVGVFLLVDIRKRKFYSTPFLFSYLLFLGPALLFESRQAPYYNYIGSLFLFMGLALVFKEIYVLMIKAVKRINPSPAVSKSANIIFVLIILLGVFKVNEFMMDNCFLIQYPWQNSKKVVVGKITEKIDKMISEGNLEYGQTIYLSDEENTDEAKFIIGSGVLQLFLKSPDAKNYFFELHDGAIEVVKPPV